MATAPLSPGNSLALRDFEKVLAKVRERDVLSRMQGKGSRAQHHSLDVATSIVTSPLQQITSATICSAYLADWHPTSAAEAATATYASPGVYGGHVTCGNRSRMPVESCAWNVSCFPPQSDLSISSTLTALPSFPTTVPSISIDLTSEISTRRKQYDTAASGDFELPVEDRIQHWGQVERYGAADASFYSSEDLEGRIMPPQRVSAFPLPPTTTPPPPPPPPSHHHHHVTTINDRITSLEYSHHPQGLTTEVSSNAMTIHDVRKARNRLAAMKCRAKKMEQIRRLEKRVADLRSINCDLEKRVFDLRGEIQNLHLVYVHHRTNGCRI